MLFKLLFPNVLAIFVLFLIVWDCCVFGSGLQDLGKTMFKDMPLVAFKINMLFLYSS